MYRTRQRPICFFTLLFLAGVSTAQQFHFGLTAAALTSQVDGDNLRGFHKFGFTAGLVGGYSVSEDSWIVVELQYTTLGSEQRNEESGMRLETDLETVNVLLGYSLLFGDDWDGSRRFRLLMGPRIHTIYAAQLGSTRGRDQVRSPFISAHAGFGTLLTRNLMLDLSYNHVLGNVLDREISEIEKLTPYYLSLGLTCYLYRG